jgi:hypothetical protein
MHIGHPHRSVPQVDKALGGACGHPRGPWVTIAIAHAVFGAHDGERQDTPVPTEVRGIGEGFCYNAGRGVPAVFPVLIGALSMRLGLGKRSRSSLRVIL